VFHSLIHHINEPALHACFQSLDGKKAIGIDGVSKAMYAADLEANIDSLVRRMKSMSYRPGAIRQVSIPKGDGKSMRTLGISNFEDKLIQMMFHRVLESIYEPLFLDCSYGFRPGRSAHDAIQALNDHLYHHEVATVIDVDLANYFDRISHKHLVSMLEEKIKDTRFMRYLKRLLKAGVLAEGELQVSAEGVAQGSVCSPILANIYAHTVIDEWFEQVVKPRCRGRVALFRYGDDIVICCQREQDADRIKTALAARLNKYALALNEEKTHSVPFSKRAYAHGERQGTFDFLGFTFYLGRTRGGFVVAKVKTSANRKRQNLTRVNQWARRMRNQLRLPDLWHLFCQKLRGHVQYFGVSGNARNVRAFVFQAIRIMFKWLNRRSQRKSFNWDQYLRFRKRFPPPQARIVHRLYVTQ